ncbi:MAG: endonuclease domain-containing protein [Mesonia sp.]|uniref:endonuclease domain-containing protein n=1 Tax=Mesonia sp. TaxID=1960830 RepID=UPI003F99508F
MFDKNPYHSQSMFKGAPPGSFKKARILRQNMTKAEKFLWRYLKNGKLSAYKFRRQHPIHLFIVDFYCHSLKLVIEVDGAYHNYEEQKLKDKERSELLKFQDLKVIRFTNQQVLNSIDFVLEEIRTYSKLNSTS